MDNNQNNQQNQVNNNNNPITGFIEFIIGGIIFLVIMGLVFGWFKGNPFIGTWECKKTGYTITFRDDKTGIISDGVVNENFTYKVEYGTSARLYQQGKEDKYASMNDNKDAFTLGIYTYSKK